MFCNAKSVQGTPAAFGSADSRVAPQPPCVGVSEPNTPDTKKGGFFEFDSHLMGFNGIYWDFTNQSMSIYIYYYIHSSVGKPSGLRGYNYPICSMVNVDVNNWAILGGILLVNIPAPWSTGVRGSHESIFPCGT